MTKIELVLATANPHKAEELKQILGEEINLLDRPLDLPDIDETGSTLLENARLKAVGVARAANKPAIADDTGLFVEALGGAPGVYSARYAGEYATDGDNVEKVLAELGRLGAKTPLISRKASFRTVAIAVLPDGKELSYEGQTWGTIIDQMRGNQGFGYDVIFVPDEGDGRTFAEMSSSEKHAISHRGRAFRGLKEILQGEKSSL